MEYIFSTPLKGTIALTNTLHNDLKLRNDKSLYKIIWVQSGQLSLEIDFIPVTLKGGELVALTPLHHIAFQAVDGIYTTYLFNSNFYCIYGHDNEVSCNGLLFYGTSNPLLFQVTDPYTHQLTEITKNVLEEYKQTDSLQEEMLRILLKRLIISCTRMARERFSATDGKEKSFDIIRQYYVLVDTHFREKKQVQEYAELLHRSPKTITNLFLSYGLPSPLKIIHERLETEARRLLLYSTKSAKEIAEILGFEDLAAFSRFFKNATGKNITDYRKKTK